MDHVLLLIQDENPPQAKKRKCKYAKLRKGETDTNAAREGLTHTHTLTCSDAGSSENNGISCASICNLFESEARFFRGVARRREQSGDYGLNVVAVWNLIVRQIESNS